MREPRIILHWRDVAHAPERWNYTLALYAIVHPATREILYLGKADGSTVRRRWSATDKHERVWSRMERELDLHQHCFIVAEFRMRQGTRLTRELVSDIEALLIHTLKPWANRQCITSRGFPRPGMVVCCQGNWPHRRTTFRDETRRGERSTAKNAHTAYSASHSRG